MVANSSRTSALFFVLFFLMSPFSFGAQKQRVRTVKPRPPIKKPIEVSTSQPEFAAIDILQERLIQKHKSKVARTLKKSNDFLLAGKFTRARDLSVPIQKNQIFSDYGFWISALADRGNGEVALKAKHGDESLKLFDRSIADLHRIELLSPFSPLTKQVQKEIGLSELLKGNALALMQQWGEAVSTYDRAFYRLQATSSMDEASPESLGHYAESCARARKTKVAEVTDLCDPWIDKFIEIHAKGSEELKAITVFYPEVETRAKAVSQGTRSSQVYKSPDLDQAAFDVAMQLLVNEKNKQSMEAFRKLLDDYPRSGHRYRARYWLAQAMDRDGGHDKAKKLFEELEHDTPLTYYGMLSSIATGRTIGMVVDPALPIAANLDHSLSPQEIFRLRRAEMLVAEGASELAATELKDMKARDMLSSPFLFYLAALNNEAGNYGNCFSILGALSLRSFPGVLSAHSIQMIFPLVHLSLIEKYAAESALDPILVLSLIKQESAFEKQAASSVGALGVMQVMPTTAAEIEIISHKDLQALDSNIRVGTKYLRRLMTRFNGNIVLSLAGYNAGPNAADRWVRDFTTKKGMLEFIEMIPYRETREYISSIIRNYLWYSKKLTGDSSKSLSYFWNIYGPPEKPAELKSHPMPQKEQQGDL